MGHVEHQHSICVVQVGDREAMCGAYAAGRFFLITVLCAGAKATLLVNGKAILSYANQQLK